MSINLYPILFSAFSAPSAVTPNPIIKLFSALSAPSAVNFPLRHFPLDNISTNVLQCP